MKWPRSPIQWPQGERLALCMNVAFELWPDDIGIPGSLQMEEGRPVPANASFRRNLETVTDREFGERVGIYRLLDIFERHRVRANFFISGLLCERKPELIREIVALGHEVSTENFIHDYSFQKTPAQEEADLVRTRDAVSKCLGRPPQGFLSTGVRPTFATPDIVARNGYLFWADPQHEELPYTLKVAGRELTVVPYLQYMNDYATFLRSMHTPRDMGQKWKDAFDCLYAEGETRPNMLSWGMHPFLLGRPYRAIVLDEFLTYVQRHAGVWITSLGDVARYWRERYHDHLVEEWPNYQLGGYPIKTDPASR